MKLLRFGDPGKEKPGILLPSGKMIDTSAYGQDYNESFFENDGIRGLSKWLISNEDKCPEVAPGTRLGPCIARPSKIICIGLNYAQHAAEGGMEVPKEPILFFKSTTAICGPGDNLIIPRNSTKTDWEVELAVVIGKKGKLCGV